MYNTIICTTHCRDDGVSLGDRVRLVCGNADTLVLTT